MRNVSPIERHSEAAPQDDAELSSLIFAEGQTLALIAGEYYGDWRLWVLIATYNAITDPRRIAPGTIILIPQRPLVVGDYESE